jgi:PAS domain S-box-containing protein
MIARSRRLPAAHASSLAAKERRRAATLETALQASERLYRALIEHSMDVITIMAADGRVSYASPSVTPLLGYGPLELVGKIAFDYLHPDDLPRTQAAFARALVADAAEIREEFRFRHKDGSWRVFESVVTNLLQEPTVAGLVINSRDITKRRAAEEALKASEVRFRALGGMAPVGIFCTDPQGLGTYLNDRLLEIIGMKPEEAAGSGWMRSIHPDDRERVAVELAHVGATGQPWRSEHRCLRPDGAITWVLAQSVVERDDAGCVIGSIGTITDITERKRAELDLTLKNVILATQQETSLDGILVEDGHGKMTSFNQHFVDLWDIPPEVAASCSSERALRWVFDKLADPDGFMARVAYLWEHHEEKSREEIALKDGRTLDRYSAPMFGADGTYYGRVWYFRDITALKRAQLDQERALSEAERASRTKSGFLANMSHELRTPLNSVIGFASLLVQNRAGNLTAEDLDFLGRIENNGKHLLEIINSILDLSKIEAGKAALEITDVALGQLIRETLSVTGCVRRGSGMFVGAVEVRPEVPPGLRPIRADAVRLKQVLINLVGNALKFTERGSVTVRVVADPATGEAERIDVVDTGIGIPQERQEPIFEAFEQADATTARRYHGSGLGLTISRTLLQQMGYVVSVASEPGVGSTFSVHLRGAGTRYGALDPARRSLANAGPAPEPVSVTAAAAAPPLADSPDKNEFCGYTVLVIDDDADSRLLLSLMIGGHGATVLTACSGEEALQLARAVRPDLVTVDVVMPLMSGWDVIQALREDPALRAIPALVVSVIADAPEGALVGTEDRLNKPINREALLAALRRHLPRGGKAA